MVSNSTTGYDVIAESDYSNVPTIKIQEMLEYTKKKRPYRTWVIAQLEGILKRRGVKSND